MRECGGCKRQVNGSLVVCPFCGHRAAAGEVVPLPPAAAPAFAHAAVAAEPSGPGCPRCGGAPGPSKMRVEVWKRASSWNPGVRKFRVLGAELPGPCDDCAGWLSARRWTATVASAGLFVLGAAIAGVFGSVVIGIATIMYGLSLLRAGSYGWIDGLLYGSELEETSSRWLPRHLDGGEARVRFPSGFLHAFVRIGLCVTLGGMFSLVGMSVHHARAHRGAEGGTLSLLSRPSAVYLPKAPGGGWKYLDVHGVHAVVAYTEWEILPAGAAERMSPRDAFIRVTDDAQAKGIVFDPGPMSIVVERSDFKPYRLHLPMWPTEPQSVVK